MIPIAKPYIGEEEIKAVEKVLRTGVIAQGSRVLNAEEKFAELCKTRYAVAMNSGTAALHSALKVTGIKEGDEVITTPFTFIATANTILMQGGKPVFCDIKEDTFNIDPEKIKEKITSNTKAILTVDLYGQLCDYEKISKIAKENNLKIIEDSCQAVGAEFKERMAGSFGDVAAFSFYATKNITCAEGGMMTTDNEEYAEDAKLFRQHGRSKMTSYEYTDVGYNYRLTDIAAAILLVQIKKEKEITEKRIKNAKILTEGLKGVKGIITPVTKEGNKHVFHQYTIRVTKDCKLSRDKLIEYLKEKGVGSAVYYPKPLHLCEHFREMGYKEGDFPVAERLCNEVLSLPVHPNLTKEQLDLIVKVFQEI